MNGHRGNAFVVPAGRIHDTASLDCWCAPLFFVPCDECDSGCWKCDNGKVWLKYAEAMTETRPIVIVHNDPAPLDVQ